MPDHAWRRRRAFHLAKIPAKYPSLDPIVTGTLEGGLPAPALRRKWATQIEHTVKELRRHGVVWGDAKPERPRRRGRQRLGPRFRRRRDTRLDGADHVPNKGERVACCRGDEIGAVARGTRVRKRDSRHSLYAITNARGPVALHMWPSHSPLILPEVPDMASHAVTGVDAPCVNA
jgi:hypothetical protein